MKIIKSLKLKFFRKNLFLYFLLPIAGILSRVFFLEKMQSHWDGPDYTIAIQHYSLKNFTPSPPGYPLYIALGKFFSFFTSNPHLAILLVSALFAGIGSIIFFKVGEIIFNKTVGIIASVVFLTSPTLYFFGITANPYGILPTTASLLAIIVYLIVLRKENYGFLLGIVLSFAIGVRPQDAMFLLPLAIYGFIYLPKKDKTLAIIGFLGSFLVWFIPFMNLVGGINEYLRLILPFFQDQAKPSFSIARFEYILPILIKGFSLTLGLFGIFVIYFCKVVLKALRKPKYLTRSRLNLIILFLLWLLPSFLFNLFIRSDHAAHQMTYLSALIFLSSYAMWKSSQKYKVILFGLVVFLSLFNLYTFFRNRDPQMVKPYVSQSYHYSEIVKNNIRLSAIISYIKRNYSVKTTLIETDPEIFRPVTYYLTNFNIYAYSSLDTNSPIITNTVHFSYHWNYKLTVDKTHSLFIPKNITTIIIIPNNKNYSFKNIYVEKVYLSANAFIYKFDVKATDKYFLSVHKIVRE